MTTNVFETPENQALLRQIKLGEVGPVQTEPVQNSFETPENQAILKQEQAKIRQEELKTADENLWPDFASVKRGLVGMTPEEQQRSIVSSNPERYEAVTRPVEESEKEEFFFPNFVYADTEHGIYDKETGKVFSLNRPGYTSADTKELVLGEAPYVAAAMVLPGGLPTAGARVAKKVNWLRRAVIAPTARMGATNVAMQNLNMLMQGRQNLSYPELLALTGTSVVGPMIAEGGMNLGKKALDKINLPGYESSLYDQTADIWNAFEDKTVNLYDSILDNAKGALSKLLPGIDMKPTALEKRAARLENYKLSFQKIPPFKYQKMLKEVADNVHNPETSSGGRTQAERAFKEDFEEGPITNDSDPKTVFTDSGIPIRPETRGLIEQEQQLAENFPEAMGKFYGKRDLKRQEILSNPNFNPSLAPQNTFQGRMKDLHTKPVRRNPFNEIVDEATDLEIKRLERDINGKIKIAKETEASAKQEVESIKKEIESAEILLKVAKEQEIYNLVEKTSAELEKAYPKLEEASAKLKEASAKLEEAEMRKIASYDAPFTNARHKRADFKKDYDKYVNEFIKRYDDIYGGGSITPEDFELLDKISEAELYKLLEKHGVPKERFKEFDPVSGGIMNETNFVHRTPLSSLNFDKSLSDYQDQLPDMPNPDDVRSGENLQKTIKAVSDFNKDRSSTLYNQYAKAYGKTEPTYDGFVEYLKENNLSLPNDPILKQVMEEALESGNFNRDGLLENWVNKSSSTHGKKMKTRDLIDSFNLYINDFKPTSLTPLVLDKIKPTKTIDNSVYEGPAYPILVQFEKILNPELTVAQRREIEIRLPDEVSRAVDTYTKQGKEVPPRALLEENLRQQLIQKARKDAPDKPLSAIEDAHRFLKTQIEQTYEDNTPQIRKVLEPVLKEFEENIDKPLNFENVYHELVEKSYLNSYSLPQIYRLVKPYLNDKGKEDFDELLKSWESMKKIGMDEDYEKQVDKLVNKILEDADLGVDIYKDLELFTTLKGDTKDIRKAFALYKEKFGDKEVLTKVADSLKKGQMGTEDIMKLLMASNEEPKFGEKVVDTIIKTPMVRESLGDYIRLTTLIDKNGNVRTGQEMIDKWNSVKKIKGLHKILAGDPEKGIVALQKAVNNQASFNIARKKGKTKKDGTEMSLGQAADEILNAMLPYSMPARVFRAVKRQLLGLSKSENDKKELQEFFIKTYHGTDEVPFKVIDNASDFTKATTRGLGAYAVKPELSDEEEDE